MHAYGKICSSSSRPFSIVINQTSQHHKEPIEVLRYSTFAASSSATLAPSCDLASIVPRETPPQVSWKRMKIELETLSSGGNMECFFTHKRQW